MLAYNQLYSKHQESICCISNPVLYNIVKKSSWTDSLEMVISGRFNTLCVFK